MEKELPKRKPTRLENYDYSSAGAYFITICTRNRKRILSEIVKNDVPVSVGEGLAPPEYLVKLKPCGEIAEEQLRSIENRFENVSVEAYVIMPNHIHIIVLIRETAGGASPSPTLNDVICAFKSLTSRICKQRHGIEKIFQRSYMDHIIRNRQDYDEHIKYICENPMRWHYDELYSEE